MRHTTLLELAERDGIRLPDALVADWPPQLSAADEKGWFRFQRLYDVARSVLRTEDDVRRLVREAAEDDVRDGGRWLEIQVDPSGYAARFGGITAFTDLVLDAVARRARARPGSAWRVVIAANRTRHPLDARTLARLAAQYAGRGVVGFGLSNDERRGTHRRLRARLPRSPSGPGCCWSRTAASCAGPTTWCTCLDHLHADRLGHGVRSAEDPALLERIVAAGVALEVCPVSNVALGVYSDLTSVPLPELLEAGATSRSAPTTRCCSGRGWPASTPRCAPPTTSPTTSSPSWRGCRSARRRRPDELKSVGPRRHRRLAGRRRGLSSELAADQHRLVDQPDPERRLDAVADLAGEGEQSSVGGAAAVGEGQRVLGGEGDTAPSVRP